MKKIFFVAAALTMILATSCKDERRNAPVEDTSVRDSLQASYFARQPEMEQQALALLKTDRDSAIALLSDYSDRLGDQMVKRWRDMGWHMVVKYNDGVVRQEENGRYKRNSSGYRPILTRPGMSPNARQRIHRSTGTRFEIPPAGKLDGSYM